jgi:hypothetical protein
MAETSIGDNHRAYLAKVQHVGEWLAGELARVEAEYRLVQQQAQRHAAEFTAFVQRNYGLDAAHQSVTLDVERGVLITPDAPDAPAEPPSNVTPFGRVDATPASPQADAPPTAN